MPRHTFIIPRPLKTLETAVQISIPIYLSFLCSYNHELYSSALCKQGAYRTSKGVKQNMMKHCGKGTFPPKTSQSAIVTPFRSTRQEYGLAAIFGGFDYREHTIALNLDYAHETCGP